MDYIYYSILLIGFIFLFIACSIFRKRIRFLRRGCITTARIVRIDSVVVDDDNGRKAYTPTFLYTTRTNEIYSYQSPISYGNDRWNEGDTIKLIYNTDDPRQAIPFTYEHAFGPGAILLGVATLLIFIGLGYCLTQYFFNHL